MAVTDMGLGVQSFSRLLCFTLSRQYYFTKDFLCSIDGIIMNVFCTVSITTMTYLSVDRVITIKYPLHYPIYFTKKVVLCIHLFIWLFSITLFIVCHLVFGLEITLMKEALYCSFVNESKQNLILLILSFILHFCVIFTCTVILLRIVNQQIYKTKALESRMRSLENKSGATSRMGCLMSHKRAIRTIFCMVAGYYICWSPVMTVTILIDLFDVSISPTVLAATCWFAISNSMFNSLVYLPTMREYRAIFKKIFIPRKMHL